MVGIDLNGLITYKHASLRYFDKKEHHVTRFCPDNVLLLVFDGVLRFSENGTEVEVKKGEYYIQRKNVYQAGKLYSDAPKYLYVHFNAEWTSGENALPYKGCFDYLKLSSLMDKIDLYAHQNKSNAEMLYLFLKLLLALKTPSVTSETATVLSQFVENNLSNISSLNDLCKKFNYSKNYIIRIFNKEFGVSPIQYINNAKIKRASYLLETTSKPVREIAVECGYSDYTYFYKRFIKSTNLSPLDWRKKMQENPFSE
ncbi:MAG: helix-turn-helix transcriptional regulator [Clostridia bacterium]|nr:helix-turn-helix transcriptional regulator [Clostridia bacterium]